MTDLSEAKHVFSAQAVERLVKEVSQLPCEELITVLEAITYGLIERERCLTSETSDQRLVLRNQALMHLIEAANILRHSEVPNGYNRKMINQFLSQLSV